MVEDEADGRSAGFHTARADGLRFSSQAQGDKCVQVALHRSLGRVASAGDFSGSPGTCSTKKKQHVDPDRISQHVAPRRVDGTAHPTDLRRLFEVLRYTYGFFADSKPMGLVYPTRHTVNQSVVITVSRYQNYLRTKLLLEE